MRNDVFVVEAGVEIPAELSEAFLVARNGCFLVRRLMVAGQLFLEAVLRTGDGYRGAGIEEFTGEGVRLCAPKIPRRQLLEVEEFFRAVHCQFGGAEAIVFLYFCPARGQWMFAAPEQTVSGGHLDWESPGPPPAGWYLAGSFHSHGSMGAFHSGTDQRDEVDWDGIHVTVGQIQRSEPEYAASIMIGGHREKVAIADLMELPPSVNFPAAWLGQVSRYVPPVSVLATGFGLGRDGVDSVEYGGQVVATRPIPKKKGGKK